MGDHVTLDTVVVSGTPPRINVPLANELGMSRRTLFYEPMRAEGYVEYESAAGLVERAYFNRPRNRTSATSSSGGTATSSSRGNAPGEAVMGRRQPTADEQARIEELEARLERAKQALANRSRAEQWAIDHGLMPDNVQAYHDRLQERIADLKAGNSRGLKAIDDGFGDFVWTTAEGIDGTLNAAAGGAQSMASDLGQGNFRGAANTLGRGARNVWNGITGIPEAIGNDLSDAGTALRAGDIGGALSSTALAGTNVAGVLGAGRAVTRGVGRRLAREEIERPPANRNRDGVNCTNLCRANPVTLDDGAKVSFDREFTLPGAPAIALSRSYYSRMAWSGPLGANRIGPLDEVLEVCGKGLLFYRMERGQTATFDRPRPNPGEVSRNAKHRHLSLRAVAGRAYVVEDGGLQKRFDKFRDGVWRLAETRDRNDNVATFNRSPEGHLLRIERSDGFTFTFENDAAGLRRSVTLTAPDGERRDLLAYDYDADDNMVLAANSFDKSFRYAYDAAGRLSAYDDGTGTRTVYAYDAEGRVDLASAKDPTFDFAVRYEPEARRTVFTTSREDAREVVEYDANGDVLAETDGLGHVRRYERDPDGYLLAEIDGEGNRTEYTYDENGRTRSVTDPEGRRTLYYHDRDGRLELLFDAENNSWDWSYDERGNLDWMSDPLGIRADYAKDAGGQPISVMRHDGLIEGRGYDAQGCLQTLVDFRGGRTSFERDAFGRVVAVVDPVGGRTFYAYGEAKGSDFWSPSTITRPDGVTVSRSYDETKAAVTLVDGEGRQAIYRYGAYDLLTEIEDTQGGRVRLVYDHDKRLERVENQKGRQWTFERDAGGRVVRETDFAGLVLEYRYDRAGRVTETRYPDGARIAYRYDRSGRVVQEDAFEPGAETPDVTRYGYDGRGLLARAENGAATVRIERDKVGRVTAETVNGRHVESVYNCCGDREERRIGGRLVCTLYDPLGALRELTVGEAAPLAFGRDKLGREHRRETAAGFDLTQAWDAASQLVQQTGSGDIARSYDFDRAYAPRSIADRRWGRTEYRTDPSGQIGETRFGEGESERFGYDTTFNLAGFGDEGGALGAFLLADGGRVERAAGPNGERIALQYDARHRVIERRVERDGFRPKVWRYGWDARDRLVRCTTPGGETWITTYDPFGRRTAKVRRFRESERLWVGRRFPRLAAAAPEEATVWNARAEIPAGLDPLDRRPPVVGTAYQWDGDVVAEEAPLRLDGTIDWDEGVRWHYEPGSFRPLAREAADGTLAYVVTDHLGTPRELVDASGALLWAAEHRTWGSLRRLWVTAGANDNEPSIRSGSGGPGGGRVYGALALKEDAAAVAASRLCPIRFQGQWEDEESGLFYNRYRHYDPLIGQYASPDPIGLAGGLRAQGYVRQPTTWIDPLGLAPCCAPLEGGAGWRFDPTRDVDLRGTGKTYRDALDEAFRRTGVPRDQFKILTRGYDRYGKSIPVEYVGPRNAKVNMDIPEWNNVKPSGLGAGPWAPHIGYQTPGKPNVSGHIFVDDVPATR